MATHKVKPVPDGYGGVTPYLIVKNAAKALDYYQKAFGAKEKFRMDKPDGKVGHAEISIGDSIVMLADEFPEMGHVGPQSMGGTPVSLHMYVEDVDARFKQALAAGGKEKRKVQDQFYGDRSGSLEDPFGHIWHLSTHKEDLTPEEIDKRATEAMKKS
jgi:PhnB protein